jgi:hypothetical protein
MIPGVGVPLAGAAGAAMRGLDRPGKRGIGFDAGAAARGGLEGLQYGGLGAAAKAGIGKLLGPSAAPPSAVPAPPDGAARMAQIGQQTGTEAAESLRPFPQSLGGTEPIRSSVPMPPSSGLPSGPSRAMNMSATQVPTPFSAEPAPLPSLGSSAAPSPQGSFFGQARGMAGNLAGGVGRGLGSVLDFTKANPEAVGMGLQAAAGIMGSQSQRRIEEERLKEERRRAENLARFALPMYMQGMR